MGKVYVFAGFLIVIAGAVFVGIIAWGMFMRIRNVIRRRQGR